MAKLFLAAIAVFLWLGGPAAQAAETLYLAQSPTIFRGSPGESENVIPHECIRFDPDSVYVAGDAGGYWLAGNGGIITEVDGSRAEARLAVYIIRFYGMTEFCRIGTGRGALTYYLVNGYTPRSRSPSEDCLWFDAAGSQLLERDGQWQLVDRNATALALGRDEAAAKEAVKTIRRKDFSDICFVGRPNPSMVYFIR